MHLRQRLPQVRRPRVQLPRVLMPQVLTSGPLALTTCAGLLVLLLGQVGGDARWLGALGRLIATTHRIPDGVPFADAVSAGWPNVPVLAELALAVPLWLAGDRGLLLVQTVAVVAGLWLLTTDARRSGAQDRSTAAVLLLVVLGGSTSLLIARLQLFSLMLFPLLWLLLRSQARRPTRHIWWLVPLFSLWSNLHGAALLGVAVAASYLLLHRGRHSPVESALVGAACALALCLTPALTATPAYYLGVLGNESARQHLGLWAPLAVSSPFDLVLVLAVVALLPAVRRSGPALWEVAALGGLAVLTVLAARNGIWLLFALAGPAATGWPRRRRAAAGRLPRAAPQRASPPLTALLWTAAVALAGFGLVHGVTASTRDPQLVTIAVRAAAGRPIAAQGVLSEQVVAAGGRVWLTNPLDAFSRADQRRFLSWSDTGQTALLPATSAIVLVPTGGPGAAALAADADFWLLAGDDHSVVYLRVPRPA